MIPFYPTALEPQPEIAQLCESWQVITDPCAQSDDADSDWDNLLSEARLEVTSEGSRYNKPWQDLVTCAITSVAPDLIFVFRFYTTQFVLPAVDTKVPIWLDIDELESKSRNRFAHMYDRDSLQCQKLLMESVSYRFLESRFLPRFERIFAASDHEVKSVRLMSPERDIRTLPNIYPRVSPLDTVESDDVFKILFVGTLGYQPNLDAISYFCSDILPIVKRGTTRAVEVDVIGGGIQEKPISLSEATLHGQVPDCSPYYARCDLSIVPLRSGGGTRIKILESFSYKRPVVSTTIGAEGLDVKNGVHLFIADGAEEFASYCLNLIEDESKRCELASKGHEFLLENHTLERLQAKIPALFGS